MRRWLRRLRRRPFDWWAECPELRQRSHVHVLHVGGRKLL